ncbi:MAG: branched-chain amino acid ABC transporter permease [Chloroflexota bacterium]
MTMTTQQTTTVHRFSIPDFVVLTLGALVLAGFVLMPWLETEVGGIELSATAARYLSEGPAVDLDDATFAAAISEEQLGTAASIVNGVEGTTGYPDLLIWGGVIGLLAALWGLLDPKTREITAIVAAVGGLLAVLYFISFFAANSHGQIDIIGYLGLGFWVMLLASVGLLLQIFWPRPDQETTPRIEFLKRTLWNNRVFLLVLIALLIAPHAIGWQTDSSPFPRQRGSVFIPSGQSAFWMSVLIEIFALAILVMSYNLMFGFTGVISFGHALFFGIGSYSIGIMVTFTNLGSTEGFLIGVGITLVLSAVIGLFIAIVSLRLRGIYFAIFTLAIAEGAWIFVKDWQLTSKDDGFSVANLPTWIDPVQSRLNLYYVSLIAFVIVFLIIQKLVNSPTGTVFKAIRENEERAKSIGYATLRYKLLSITAACTMAGVAGIIHGVLNKQNLGPSLFGVAYTVDALLMTIIGGVGTLTGPVLGAAGLHTADVLFRDAETSIGGFAIGENWLLITGFIFVLVVLVFPYGIAGTWARIQLWWRGRSNGQPYDASVKMATFQLPAETTTSADTDSEQQPSSRTMLESAIYGEEKSRSPSSPG